MDPRKGKKELCIRQASDEDRRAEGETRIGGIRRDYCSSFFLA